MGHIPEHWVWPCECSSWPSRTRKPPVNLMPTGHIDCVKCRGKGCYPPEDAERLPYRVGWSAAK
jgi:hypothetical protein